MNALSIDAQPASPNLAAVMGDSQPESHDVRFWWLGQAGFALKYRGALLLIDPYLSDSLAEKYRNSEFRHLRMMPAPVAPQDLGGCTWYLCTHGHTDHMDPGTISGVVEIASPAFVLPRAELARGRERGMPAEKMHGIDAGERLQLAEGIAVEAIAAAHEGLDVDAAGNHKFLGYIISIGGLRLYHSGDCVPYAGLERQLAHQQIDVAFLPINGRDAYRLSRGVPGNFTLEEAISLCHGAGIGYLVGHHWGLFDFNTIDPDLAAAILRRDSGALNWLLPEVGVTYTMRAGLPAR